MGAHLHERNALAAAIHPAAARAAGSYVTEAVELKHYDSLLARLYTGTLSGAATVLAKFQHCSVSASSAAAWADVHSTCVTSAFASGSNDGVGQLELRTNQHSGMSAFARVLVSVATSSWLGALTVEGEPSYLPATDLDSADVLQTVVY